MVRGRYPDQDKQSGGSQGRRTELQIPPLARGEQEWGVQRGSCGQQRGEPSREGSQPGGEALSWREGGDVRWAGNRVRGKVLFRWGGESAGIHWAENGESREGDGGGLGPDARHRSPWHSRYSITLDIQYPGGVYVAARVALVQGHGQLRLRMDSAAQRVYESSMDRARRRRASFLSMTKWEKRGKPILPWARGWKRASCWEVDESLASSQYCDANIRSNSWRSVSDQDERTLG